LDGFKVARKRRVFDYEGRRLHALRIRELATDEHR
jgi:hypothetical protein